MHIDIKNWEKFQHYKDRRPTWVKLLIEIIEEFDDDGLPKKFHKLPDSAKLTFILLACLRANYNKHIPYPSDKWLKKRLGISTVNLQPLVDAGFIYIDTEMIQDDTELIQDSTKVLAPERERETYTKETERERETENSIEFQLSSLLFELIRKRKPDYKKPDLQSWAKHIDLMIRLDNRNPKRIREVIQWSQTDSFWQNNILSTIKLRKHFDRLEMQMNEREGTTKSECVGAIQTGRQSRPPRKNRDYNGQGSDGGVSIDNTA